MNDDKTVPKRYTCGTDGTAIEVGNEERIDTTLRDEIKTLKKRIEQLERENMIFGRWWE